MKSKMKTYDLITVALFAALIAVGAFIQVPIPYVPFTLQTFFVVLAGLILGHKYGAISASVYMIIGLIGIPVFTQGGGISYVLKPSFGYIVGFIVGAFVTGFIVSKAEKPSFKLCTVATLAGLVVIYVIGMIYMGLIVNLYMGVSMGLTAILWSGCILFLPGDISLCILAAYIGKRFIPQLKNRH